MTSALLAPSLQATVDRFNRSLIVPSRLLALHPRKQANPGNAAALAPAVALGVISAFEGFVEDFFATVLYRQGQSFGQIARKVEMNNPELAMFEKKVVQEFPTLTKLVGNGFTISVWLPRTAGGWNPGTLGWAQAKDQAEGWMQVRHCLSHGLASGWRSEVWPGPIKANTKPASSVLCPKPNGRHSLVMHGAITCARTYLLGAQHLADLVASQLGEALNWDALPDFALRAAAS